MLKPNKCSNLCATKNCETFPSTQCVTLRYKTADIQSEQKENKKKNQSNCIQYPIFLHKKIALKKNYFIRSRRDENRNKK